MPSDKDREWEFFSGREILPEVKVISSEEAEKCDLTLSMTVEAAGGVPAGSSTDVCFMCGTAVLVHPKDPVTPRRICGLCLSRTMESELQ